MPENDGVVENNQPEDKVETKEELSLEEMVQQEKERVAALEAESEQTQGDTADEQAEEGAKEEGTKEEEITDKKAPDELDDNTDNTEPEKYDLGELGQFTKEELKQMKSERLMQQDYTRKTQELAKQRKEYEEAITLYEYLRDNPELAKELGNGNYKAINDHKEAFNSLDPNKKRVDNLEEEVTLMKFENSLLQLESKFEDFDRNEVLLEAEKMDTSDFESIYYMLKGKKTKEEKVDIDQIKKQVRKELLEDIKKGNVMTDTIVGSNDKAPEAKPQLSGEEAKWAEAFGVSPEDWIKRKKS